MGNFQRVAFGLAGWLVLASAAMAQQARPYIGFVYPAGGQQGTTFQILLGGQAMDGVDQAFVSGAGVTAKIVEYRRKINPQEIRLLRDQLRQPSPPAEIVARIKKRIQEYVQRPEAASLANLLSVEVTIAPDAAPGRREITISTPRGVSNPLIFVVGQLPEVSRKAMTTSEYEVLGKEKLALRKRPDSDIEQTVTLPCVLNGQIASGEENRYRFQAKKGQRLVFSAEARELNPFFADAVPGWFQGVMAIYDASGKEVAYDDDFHLKPDPVILYQAPKDGEYILTIYDALYRGREDFVYRITAGETPFITSIFPLGGKLGCGSTPAMQGWNLAGAKLTTPPSDAKPGVYSLSAVGKDGIVSNAVRYKLDALPECVEQEPNNDIAHAQKVTLPIIINGHIDHPDDWDVFQFDGHADQTIVAQVEARVLDSSLDSFLKITDNSGKVLAFDDDYDNPEAGTNTHDADSYIMFKLPADGTYFVHLGDATRHGGASYAYRLRISEPRPDFALRTVPSSLSLRKGMPAAVKIEAIRKDGFRGTINLALKDAPPGLKAMPVSLTGDTTTSRFVIKPLLTATQTPLTLNIEGSAKIGGEVVCRPVTPAEDKMQAFLWRHIVPAQELRVEVINPQAETTPKRVPREFSPEEDKALSKLADAATKKFTKKQVKGRLQDLKLLFEEGLLTDEFYRMNVLECEAAQ